MVFSDGKVHTGILQKMPVFLFLTGSIGKISKSAGVFFRMCRIDFAEKKQYKGSRHTAGYEKINLRRENRLQEK